uniref:Armadillo repeat-containing domain-containing protein n=1 Tax=Timema genevievae TaxID=629358 RepID=A0A7R9K322_TIMGE|nr:unnamed protein product [Timema genevievae]
MVTQQLLIHLLVGKTYDSLNEFRAELQRPDTLWQDLRRDRVCIPYTGERGKNQKGFFLDSPPAYTPVKIRKLDIPRTGLGNLRVPHRRASSKEKLMYGTGKKEAEKAGAIKAYYYFGTCPYRYLLLHSVSLNFAVCGVRNAEILADVINSINDSSSSFGEGEHKEFPKKLIPTSTHTMNHTKELRLFVEGQHNAILWFGQRFAADWVDGKEKMVTPRVLLSIAVKRNLHLQNFDVKSAFLKSPLKVPVFIKLLEGYPDEHRLYFRRLSQTTQTDVLLGNLDMTGSGKVILRPLSVQERIRELNLRARMFTDTMLAIQGISPRHSPLPGPRSLQCSPWSSPRILSPVDVRHILASRSTENLSGLAIHGELVGSPIRRRWSRRSLRRSVPSKSRSPEGYREYEEIGRKEAEKLLRDGEEELRLHLESLSNRDRVITAHEAKSLVALLHSRDELLLERTLTTIANCGTFSANQDTLREAGCLFRLQNLLVYPKTNVKLSAIKALGNLALNQENQKELKIQDAIPLLLTFVNKEQPTEKLLLSALLTLSNIAVLSDWHDEFYPVLHALYQLVDTGAPQVKLQALKLLVNLSCNEDMVPSLLAAQAPRRLIYFLDPSTNEDILLRVVTLLANLTTTAKEQKLDPTIDLPAEDKAASPDTMYAAIYGVNIQEKIRSKAFVLMNQHGNEDIRVQARKIYEAVKS